VIVNNFNEYVFQGKIMSEDNKDLVVVDDTSQEMVVIKKNRADDYEYARDLLYASAEKLQDILEAATELAKESEHPRAIEVAAQTASALTDVAKSMMDHHLRTEKLINPNSTKNKGEVTNNNLNVELNTRDLLEFLGRDL